MYQVPFKLSAPLFSPDTRNYIRFFSPHVIKNKGKTRVLGTFGLIFLPFERFWGDRYTTKSLMTSLYASNIEFLLDPPDLSVLKEEIKYDWFSKIRTGLDLFPASLPEFLSGVSNGMVGAFPLDTIIGDRSKFAAFLQWIRDEKEIRDSN
jgi:hypothetical protein